MLLDLDKLKEKYDITEVGHFSGTGLINFNKKENFIYE